MFKEWLKTTSGKVTFVYLVVYAIVTGFATLPGPHRPICGILQRVFAFAYVFYAWGNYEYEMHQKKEQEKAKLTRGDSGLWFGCCEVCGKIDKSKRGSYRPLTPGDFEFHGWKCNGCLLEAREALEFQKAVET